MSHTVISVQNVSKYYRLGLIGGGTLRADFERWWARVRGRPDPLLKIGHENQSNRQGEYIWALRDVSFQVQQGEVLGIIGRNGAGKSTLLKILSRVTAPTAGQVKVKGRVASLLEVGTGFHPELTGRENIYLNGAILGMKKVEIDHKYDEIVTFSEVEKFIDTPVKRYSTGMYVRLAFAIAAHLDPDILLVDEVLAVGDASFQQKCLRKMGKVSEQGRTVLFVSHNMAAISALCKSALLLHAGRLAFQNTTDQVISEYLRITNASIQESLTMRTDRKGDGRVRIVGFDVLSENGTKVDQIMSGQDVAFVIDYQVNDPHCINNSIVVGVMFKGLFGQPLFNCLSRVIPNPDLRLVEGKRLVCYLYRLPLLPGEYQCDVFCKVNETITDYLQPAGRISVVPGDYYKSGKLPPSQTGEFLVDFKWEIIDK